jgi:hypothetical protein
MSLKLYLTFIRPLLEYAGDVWDNCALADSERLEKNQLEAARIVTGLTFYASDFFCLLTEFCLSLWKIARSSVILLLPLFINHAVLGEL